uniref:uncharacterized protein LOC120951273 n=1 Tax=Anopheles coluzzii TaxID=1518534 RepID=UPI0020FFB09E|nr:uncharacterized protein LOC120951273 [Anopheles coluzzii]
MSTRLKYWFNIGSFFETMKPNIRVLKLFGLFPYTISQAKGRSFPSNSHHSNNRCNHSKTLKSEVKFIDIAIFTLWQTFFLQMLYVSWPKMFLNMPVSRIITMVTLILYLLAGFNCSVSATLVLLFRKKFLHMVQLVEEADFLVNKAVFQFSKYFYEIQHSKHHLVCVALLLGSFASQGLLILNDYTAGKMLVNTTLSLQSMPMQAITSYYYIIRSIHISCVVAFISGLYSFRDRFFAFNKQLRICFVEKHSGEQAASYRVLMNHIQGFTAIYSNLCDAIGIFCTIFAWQVIVCSAFYMILSFFSNFKPMMFCASLIVTVVFSILTIGHMLTNPAPIVLALALIYSALTILYTLLFLVLVKLGSDLKREGKQTAVLVHKAINQSSKTPALVERVRKRNVMIERSCATSSYFSLTSVRLTMSFHRVAYHNLPDNPLISFIDHISVTLHQTCTTLQIARWGAKKIFLPARHTFIIAMLPRCLVLFSHHLQHQRPVVSCGLFCFDWTLALSIISALATYSVILIQFELGVPKFFISAILQQNGDMTTTNPQP